MIINRVADVKCKSCGAPLRLREYKGLEGSWYSGGCENKCIGKPHTIKHIERVARDPVDGDER